MKNSLVAYDGSETSKRAIDTAADLIASDARIHLDIVNVVSIPMLSDDQASSFAAILDLMKSDAEEVLADALNQFEGRHQQNGVDTLLVLGTDVASEIAKLIEKNGYDMVVIGSRGLSGMKQYLGSVSHKLLGATKAPVLVVK